MNVHELMELSKDNFSVFDGFAKAFSVISRYQPFGNIACSISGGKDSDIVLDIVSKFDPDKRIHYVWFDTGLEYQATKDHLSYLEQRYDIKIERERAIKPIPLTVKEYGQPFVSKVVSEQIGRLQHYGFKWEDRPYEELIEEYPNCKSAISWWCNHRNVNKYGYSMFNINYNKYLKEFMIENPPWFPISQKCCTFAKKKVAAKFVKENDIELMITGVRKAEGGVRSAAYKTCFDAHEDACDQYRPVFWYSNEDEEFYDQLFGIQHSDCYCKWGMTRTGCVGCPFNRKVTEELSIIEEHEPKMFKAVNNIFGDSYEYTRMYREYAAKRKARSKWLDNLLKE